MLEAIKILDHGYLKYVEHWGSDERIIESARMSTSGQFRGWEQDERLLRFLYDHKRKNKHTSPFEMAGLVVEVQAPIFVFREWHRHRTQSYNEMSARYVPLPDYNYIPSVDRLLMRDAHGNRQASPVDGAPPLTEKEAEGFCAGLREVYAALESAYQESLSRGVSKEIARIMLPVGRYSRMRASANLHNWLHFLTLRMAPESQWEIRQYANAIGSLIKHLFPRTWQLFAERLG